MTEKVNSQCQPYDEFAVDTYLLQNYTLLRYNTKWDSITNTIDNYHINRYMRGKNVEGINNLELLKKIGLDEATVNDMYRIMALANYEDRFVIPTNHREYSGETPFDNEIAFDTRSSCGFSFGNGCSDDVGKTSLFGTKTHKNTMSGKVPKTSKTSKNS